MRIVSSAVAIVILSTPAACDPAEQTARTAAPIVLAGADAVADVLRFRDEHMMALIDHRDMDRIISHYAADAVYAPPRRAAVVGKNAIRAFLTEFFSRALIGVRFENRLAEVNGDLAVLRDSYDAVIIPHAGEQSAHAGEDVWILRRADDGWKIVGIIWTKTTSKAP